MGQSLASTAIVWPRLRLEARHGQIAAQCILLAILSRLDFGPSPVQAAVYIGGALAMDAMRAWATGEASNWKSALSTGLSLSLLLRTHEPALWIAAPVLAMGSKWLLRVNGKQLFNPSGFAIVALLSLSPHVWVSPGQWGTRLWLIALAGSMAFLILSRAGRLDIALTFLAARATLLVWRALSLGDPMAVPLHQMQSGALLIFALFMLTDPRSTPDSRLGRVLFALAVAVVAHLLLFVGQVPEAPFFALILVSCVTPLIDRTLPGRRFAWPNAKETETPCVPSPGS